MSDELCPECGAERFPGAACGACSYGNAEVTRLEALVEAMGNDLGLAEDERNALSRANSRLRKSRDGWRKECSEFIGTIEHTGHTEICGKDPCDCPARYDEEGGG